MSSFSEQLNRLRQRPGVRNVVAVGRDGLVIDGGPDGDEHSEHLAALTPGLVAAAELLADAAGTGALRAIVVESDAGFLLVLALGAEVAAVAALDPESDPGAALAELRAARGALAGAL